ncbi:MAG: LLM class F420-dependent oxidoreductase [Acidimicrobiales bacterium]
MTVEPRGLTCASYSALGLPVALQTAKTAAAAGFGSFWAAETTGPEAFTLLSAAGAAEPSLALGTGIVPIQFRTPQTVAMAAATLQALQPDRDIHIGIGVSSPIIVEQWHGAAASDRPLAQLREYVTLLRACWSGEPVDFAGEFYQCRGFRLGVRLGERKPKVVLGALNPRMLRLAGEIADGVLLNYIPASHVPWSVEQVRAGGNATIYGYVHLGVAERNETTDKLARRDLYSYASAPGYRRNFARAGYESEMATFEAARADRSRDGAIAAISDRMINEIDIVGDAATVRAAWQSYVDAGIEHPILMPLPWGPDRLETILATIEALS